jgi:hypothetical protein
MRSSESNQCNGFVAILCNAKLTSDDDADNDAE